MTPVMLAIKFPALISKLFLFTNLLTIFLLGNLASFTFSHRPDLHRVLLGHVRGQSGRQGQVLRVQGLYGRRPEKAGTSNG